ncbi:MAG: YkgJ family cysteine cluster protein [Armatimonadota bacterium]
MSDWDTVCDGCTGCAMRCTDNIRLSEFEYTRIIEELHALDPRTARRVLEQSKTRIWFEETTYTACLFHDVDSGFCLIYPARPLVCRVFGRVRHLPCPENKVPADLDVARVLQAYTAQPLRTFQEWMMLFNIFNFTDLLGTPDEPPSYEI